MGRYTLVRNGQPIPNFTKVELSAIDKYTTNFSSKISLAKNLMGKHDGISELKIYYNAQGEKKELDVAYDDKKELQNINIMDKGKIDYSSSIFIKTINSFIKELKEDEDFYNFAMSSSFLSPKAKEYASIVTENNDTFYRNKLQEHVGTYSAFRKLLFLLEAYAQFNLNRNVEKMYKNKPDSRIKEWFSEDEYYTEEELAKYIEYMDSLPGSEPDYRR